MTTNPSNPSRHNGQTIRSWIAKHRGGIVWFAVLALLLFVQWPMVKGMFYRVSGSPAPADGIPWRTDFNAALAESKQSGKPVLLDFSASWCPPCQVMKHDVWPDPKVRDRVNGAYIPVFVDVDTSASGELSSRYGISTIPSIVIVDAEGRVLKQGSFMSASSLSEFLEKKPASWRRSP